MAQGKAQAAALDKTAAPPAVDKQPVERARPVAPLSVARLADLAISGQRGDPGAAGRARTAATLQRSVGNTRLSRLLSPAGAGAGPSEFAVTPPDSPSERQAESVSRQVAAGRRAAPIAPMSPPQLGMLRRRERDEETAQAGPAPISRQAASGSPGAPGGSDPVARAIDGRGPGGPVNPAMRRALEPRMGADLGGARIHRDSAANEAAGALNARAFTHGSDVYLGRGESERDTRLMAHELTHVVQNDGAAGPTGAAQRLPLVSRQPAGGSGPAAAPAPTAAPPPTAPKPAQPEGEVAPGVVELMGKPGLEPGADTLAFFAERKTGVVNVRFGELFAGPIQVKKAGSNLEIVKRQAVAFKQHPLFTGLQEHMPGLAPALIVRGDAASVTGYVGPAAGTKIPESGDLTEILEKAPAVLGLAGFSLPKLDTITNRLQNGNLSLGLSGVKLSLGGAFTGTVTLLSVDGKTPSFQANVSIEGQGLVKTDLNFERTDAGIITGKANVAVAHKQVSGSVDVAWDGRALTGTGKVGYQGEKFSGEVTVYLMEKAKAVELAQQKQAPPEEAKQGAATAAPAGGGKAPAKGRAAKEDYVVFGEGDLTFAFNEWLNGTAHVIIDHEGYLTVIGKITPQAEFILFKQQDYEKQLFKLEARAAYGLPVVGNIFIFGNVSLAAFATIGPGKLYKIVAEGTYSTNPKEAQSFTIQCSLNVSAAAGLRLRGEAGAGLEILSHDLKAGAGINALAGIRGYAEATPVIGYREKAAAAADQKGEFFIKGDLEIAAQPFLGLSGDLFVEVDAPWWSPVPDKKWTWPLGQKEWPIGGSFGVVATVEHVLGSGQFPSLEFKPVEFSSDKFLSDLYSDKAAPKSGDKGEQPGTWKEKNEKTAEPPEKGAAKGVPPGKGAPPAPAKSEAAPKGAKQPGKAADPAARTADGKTVKELQDEAAKKGKKPEGAEAGKGAGKDEAAKKEGDKGEREKLVADDQKKIDQITKRFDEEGTTKEELDSAIKGIKGQFKAIKSVTVIDGGEDWDFEYVASPATKKDGPKKSAVGQHLKQAKKEFKRGLFSRDELQELLDVSKTTALDRINQWKQDGILFENSSLTFDNQTKYSFDKAKEGHRETSEGNRERYGYTNPPGAHPIVLVILSKGLRKDSPKPQERESPEYHKKRARYDSKRPGSSYKDFGWEHAIIGHKEDASAHWNRIGHKQPKEKNRAWNWDPDHYWGPEHETESAASGAEAPRYREPSRKAKSHASWLDDD